MSDFNMNAPKPQPVEMDDELWAGPRTHNTVEDTTEATPEPYVPDVHLEGIEMYKDIIAKLKVKLAGLIQEGLMSEAVATRIADEFSYNAFQQAVKVKYE